MASKKDNTIMVEREIYEKDGKEYFSYFIKGNVRGKDIRVLITPPDRGGFAVLDIVFNNEMKAELVVSSYEIKDDATGKIISGNMYSVKSVDADGTSYECPIKPFRPSDKALLNMLIR